MSNIMDMRRGRNGTFQMVHKKRGKAGCPGWLLHKYRAWRPRYSYAYGMCDVNLERVEWRRDLKEWVAVYAVQLYEIKNPNNRSKEEYTWVWRDNQLLEIGQRQSKVNWRSRREDWRS